MQTGTYTQQQGIRNISLQPISSNIPRTKKALQERNRKGKNDKTKKFRISNLTFKNLTVGSVLKDAWGNKETNINKLELANFLFISLKNKFPEITGWTFEKDTPVDIFILRVYEMLLKHYEFNGLNIHESENEFKVDIYHTTHTTMTFHLINLSDVYALKEQNYSLFQIVMGFVQNLPFNHLNPSIAESQYSRTFYRLEWELLQEEGEQDKDWIEDKETYEIWLKRSKCIFQEYDKEQQYKWKELLKKYTPETKEEELVNLLKSDIEDTFYTIYTDQCIYNSEETMLLADNFIIAPDYMSFLGNYYLQILNTEAENAYFPSLCEITSINELSIEKHYENAKEDYEKLESFLILFSKILKQITS